VRLWVNVLPELNESNHLDDSNGDSRGGKSFATLTQKAIDPHRKITKNKREQRKILLKRKNIEKRPRKGIYLNELKSEGGRKGALQFNKKAINMGKKLRLKGWSSSQLMVIGSSRKKEGKLYHTSLNGKRGGFKRRTFQDNALFK